MRSVECEEFPLHAEGDVEQRREELLRPDVIVGERREEGMLEDRPQDVGVVVGPPEAEDPAVEQDVENDERRSGDGLRDDQAAAWFRAHSLVRAKTQSRHMKSSGASS